MNEEKINKIKNKIQLTLNPIKPANECTKKYHGMVFTGIRTNKGSLLSDYYLVYFLLVELMGFHNQGKYEKVAWSIPIDYDGYLYFIEYRKMGLGIFAANKEDPNAEIIANKINKAIKNAEPYFEYIAKKEVDGINLNVKNNCKYLYERYEYFKKMYYEKYEIIKDTNLFEKYSEKQHASWMALSAIDAFYSWSEHIFIHIGILQGKILTGKQVIEFTELDWKEKYKEIIGLNNDECKKYYDPLINIKSQLRNFYAHGAFGKTGEAFNFHSNTGAVPIKITESLNNKKVYKLHGKNGFNEKSAIEVIDNFINYLWSNGRSPARVYLMETDLPVILTYANNGIYYQAMKSEKEMYDLIERLSYQFDTAANMDW